MLRGLSTEALARRSAGHPRVTVALWLLALAVGVILVGSLRDEALTTQFTSSSA